MAIALKCDRCGGLYEHHRMKYMGNYINGIQIINTNIDCNRTWDVRTLDLCPKCCEEFINWIEDKKEEDKEDGRE